MARPADSRSLVAPAAAREPVSRSAQATGAGLALALIVVGLLLRAALTGAGGALQGAAAGLVVTGLALDLYARALGVWVTRDTPALALGLALVGSPAVLAHAVARRRGPLAPEPGALGGLLVPAVLVVFCWAQISAT